MRATRLLLAAMVLGTAAAASQANAQCSSVGAAGNCSTTNTAQVVIPSLVKLGMGATTTSLTAPSADAVDAGTPIDDAGPALSIKSNRSWTLNLKSGRAQYWDFNGGLGTAKSISDLTWSATNGSGYVALSATDALLGSGASATATGTASVYFRTLYTGGLAAASNAPGTYTLPIVFTLSAP
jgi:hypothetical protein